MLKRSAPSAAAARSGARTVSPGSWLLVALLSLSLPHSLLAYAVHTSGTAPKGLAANLSDCLISSAFLMEAADVTLHQFQEGFNCTLEHNPTENPKNEEKIRKVCMEGKSMFGLCPSGENDVVDQTLCLDTIYTILNQYMMEIHDFDSPKLLDAINQMMQRLSIRHKIINQPLSLPQRSLSKKFQVQMKQCKIFLTLQQLSQTIDRILMYRKSLEM